MKREVYDTRYVCMLHGPEIENALGLERSKLTSSPIDIQYEFNHFENEGRVLYIVNKHGYITPHRTMYKIKPRDVEEVHWQTFDQVRRGQVEEAVRKIKLRNKTLTEQALREELDIQGKEWGKFGGQIMSHARRYFLVTRIPNTVRRDAMRVMRKKKR